MGCYDVTCCVSNLAIGAGDKIKFGFIMKNYDEDHILCYPNSSYAFITPIMDAEYNNYGFVDSIKQKKTYNYLHQKIESKIIEEAKHEEDQVAALVHGLSEIYVDKPCKVYKWMCHKWAFDYILKIHKLEEPEKHIMMCRTIVHYKYREFLDDACPEEYKELLNQTINFGNNLHFVRKVIFPLTSCGAQHEDNEKICGWVREVSKQATKQKKEMNG